MFKSILLGQWHSLSEPSLEESPRVRLDFILFTGFELLDGDFLDETTICRFRNRLIDKKLFREINPQLENLALKVKNSSGSILDVRVEKIA
jgi:IS5 family transposase